jgi:hypothetical protein
MRPENAADVGRRPGITPSGLPGGDVNSPFIRGAPRTVLVSALDFMRNSSSRHSERRILPLVAVSSIFTSTCPYLVNGRRSTQRIFSFLAAHLSTFRFITHVNLDFSRQRRARRNAGAKKFADEPDDDCSDADDCLELIGDDLSKIDRVLHITLGRRPFGMLRAIDGLIDGLPHLQSVEIGPRGGSLYADYWRFMRFVSDTNNEIHLHKTAKRLLTHPTLSVRLCSARMFLLTESDMVDARGLERELNGYYICSLVKIAMRQLKSAGASLRVDVVVAFARLACAAIDAFRRCRGLVRRGARRRYDSDDSEDDDDRGGDRKYVKACEDLAHIAADLMTSTSLVVQEAAISLLCHTVHQLLGHREKLARLFAIKYADGESFLHRVCALFVAFVRNELPAIIAAADLSDAAVRRVQNALYGPLHLIESVVFRYKEFFFLERDDGSDGPFLDEAVKTFANLRVYEAMWRAGHLQRAANPVRELFDGKKNIFRESWATFSGWPPSEERAPRDEFDVVLGKMVRAEPEFALQHSELPGVIAQDLLEAADGMLRRCVADLEHTNRGFAPAATPGRHDVEQFIELCNMAFDLFFGLYLDDVKSPPLRLTAGLQLENARVGSTSDVYTHRNGFYWRRELLFPPRVLEAIRTAIRVLQQERVRARHCRQSSVVSSLGVNMWVRNILNMAAVEKRIFDHALKRRGLAPVGRRRARNEEESIESDDDTTDEDDDDLDGEDAVGFEVNKFRFYSLLEDPIVQRFLDATESEIGTDADRVNEQVSDS